MADENPEGAPNGQREKSKFNWVTERSACSLPKIFRDLRKQVDEDVKTRNGLRPQNSPYEFSVSDDGSDFSVHLKAGEADSSVKFTLADHAIIVRNDKGGLFEVTLTFSDEGKCILHVNQQESELWQIRRMALEDLMFRGY